MSLREARASPYGLPRTSARGGGEWRRDARWDTRPCMADIERRRRAPTDDELAVIRARMDRARTSLRTHARSYDALFLAALGVAMAAAGFVFFSGFPRALGGVFGASLAVIGVMGELRARRELAALLGKVDRQERECAAEVEELSFSPTAVVTATAPDGEGESFWLAALGDGSHLALSSEQWDPGDAPPAEWRSRARVVLDGRGTVVRVALDGDTVPVTRSDVREPDFAVTDDTRFWAPVDVKLPAVVRDVRLLRLDEVAGDDEAG